MNHFFGDQEELAPLVAVAKHQCATNKIPYLCLSSVQEIYDEMLRYAPHSHAYDASKKVHEQLMELHERYAASSEEMVKKGFGAPPPLPKPFPVGNPAQSIQIRADRRYVHDLSDLRKLNKTTIDQLVMRLGRDEIECDFSRKGYRVSVMHDDGYSRAVFQNICEILRENESTLLKFLTRPLTTWVLSVSFVISLIVVIFISQSAIAVLTFILLCFLGVTSGIWVLLTQFKRKQAVVLKVKGDANPRWQERTAELMIAIVGGTISSVIAYVILRQLFGDNTPP